MADKIKFLGGTTGNLRNEFSERLKYKNLVDFDGMIDTLYHDYFYGFINRNFETSYIVDDPEIFSSFTGYADDVRCLSFVSSAFSALRTDYLQNIRNSNRGFPKFLDGLLPVLGYEPLSVFYGEYLTWIASSFSLLIKDNFLVNDYNCYLLALEPLLEKSLKNFPITRSGFLLSKYNNVRSSGLVIELAKLEYDEDTIKGEILQSSDFQCYLDFTKAYGFLVDKNAPWRLYADYGNPLMSTYMDKRGLTNLQSDYRMDSIYRLKSCEDDLYDLQDFILKLYNDIRGELPFYKRPIRNPKSQDRTYETVFRPEADMLTKEQWISLLLRVRMLELDVFEETEFRRNSKKVMQNLKLYGVHRALLAIGDISTDYIKRIYATRKENSPNT